MMLVMLELLISVLEAHSIKIPEKVLKFLQNQKKPKAVAAQPPKQTHQTQVLAKEESKTSTALKQKVVPAPKLEPGWVVRKERPDAKVAEKPPPEFKGQRLLGEGWSVPAAREKLSPYR